ncbi:MAG TPA: O-antigen ligase family protein [Bryobacteraceae bacterium]|nr:O-antigen ligase family protein [Bryobacteraceae bacterium]
MTTLRAHPRVQSLPLSTIFVAALMASVPLENCTVLPAIGSISRLIGLVATGMVVLDAALKLGFRRWHAAYLPLLLFVVWSAWSYIWSVYPPYTRERITTNLQLLVFVWVIWQAVRNLRDLRVVLQGFVIGACCAAVWTMVNARDLHAYSGIRFSGAGSDPNELGLTLVIGMVMAFYISTTSPTSFKRVLWLIPFPLCIVAVILTVSRSAAIETALALLCISFWHVMTSSKLRFAPIVGGVVLLAIGAAFVPKANFRRLSTIESEISTGHIGARGQLWKAGIQMFEQRPILGTGAATFAFAAEPIIGRDLAAHNTYVSVLTETGMIGFLLFATALVTFGLLSLTLRCNERFLWLIVMLVWGLGVFSLTFEYKKTTWCVFGLLVATSSVSEMAPARPRRLRRMYKQAEMIPAKA